MNTSNWTVEQIERFKRLKGPSGSAIEGVNSINYVDFVNKSKIHIYTGDDQETIDYSENLITLSNTYNTGSIQITVEYNNNYYIPMCIAIDLRKSSDSDNLLSVTPTVGSEYTTLYTGNLETGATYEFKLMFLLGKDNGGNLPDLYVLDNGKMYGYLNLNFTA